MSKGVFTRKEDIEQNIRQELSDLLLNLLETKDANEPTRKATLNKLKGITSFYIIDKNDGFNDKAWDFIDQKSKLSRKLANEQTIGEVILDKNLNDKQKKIFW